MGMLVLDLAGNNYWYHIDLILNNSFLNIPMEMKNIHHKQFSQTLAMLSKTSKRILVPKIIRIKINHTLDLNFLNGDEIWT
jgi:hypothetical protein